MNEVIDVLGRVLQALGAPPAEDLPSQLAQLNGLKSKQGRVALAAKLGLNEAELSAFESTLSDTLRWSSAPADAPRRAELIELASLTALQWLERVAAALGLPGPKVESASSDEVTAARVRALELVLRELIHESYRTQAALRARLGELFRPDTLARWERAAAHGELLTGLSFGELSSLFVSKDEYPRYQPVLEVEHYLAMLRERRKTLRSYLESVRLVRNALAHHKPLSAVQRLVVERFVEEIFSPISRSWEEGRTAINPQTHLQSSAAGLQDWLAQLSDDVRAVQDELATLREEVAGTRRDVSALEGGVALILLAGVFFVLTVVVSLVDATGSLGKPPDLESAARTTSQSLRGLSVSALTFVLAVARVALNLALFRGGGGAALRGWLTGARGRALFFGWALAGLAVFFAPVQVSAVQEQFSEIGAQQAFLQLDEAAIEAWLAKGGNPNAMIYGNSVLGLALRGAAFKTDGGLGTDEERRMRVLRRLMAAGAKPTPADLEYAKAIGLVLP